MKHAIVTVSDHAVVRYLERVKGVDMAAVRAEIAAICDPALDHDTACGVVSGGFRYKLRDLVVTTVVPAAQADIRTGRQR